VLRRKRYEKQEDEEIHRKFRKTHRRLNCVPIWHDQWKKYKMVPLDVGVSVMC